MNGFISGIVHGMALTIGAAIVVAVLRIALHFNLC